MFLSYLPEVIHGVKGLDICCTITIKWVTLLVRMIYAYKSQRGSVFVTPGKNPLDEFRIPSTLVNERFTHEEGRGRGKKGVALSLFLSLSLSLSLVVLRMDGCVRSSHHLSFSTYTHFYIAEREASMASLFFSFTPHARIR